MAAPYIDKPGLGIFWPCGHFTLVDGAHRLAALWRAGKREMQAYVFTCPFWEQFTIPEERVKEIVAQQDMLSGYSGMAEYEARRDKANARR